MGWKQKQSSFVWIFPVGRGNCAFLRTGLNHGFILDMAKGEDGFDVAKFIRANFLKDLTKYPDTDGNAIAQAVLSHPHKDHIEACGEFAAGDLHPNLLTCPNEKAPTSKDDPDERFNWDRDGNEPGPDADELIKTYKSLYVERSPPLQSIQFKGMIDTPNLEYGLYYVRPPVCDKLHEAKSATNEYGNATSIMFYFRHGNHSILFPGDMTPEGTKLILEEKYGAEKRYTRFYKSGAAESANWHLKTGTQPALKKLLKERGLSVLVAPHHGLKSCYSEDLYKAIYAGDDKREHKPTFVCVSERRKAHKNDGDTDPRYFGDQGATGVTATVDGKTDTVKYLSTKAGLHILIVMNPTSPLKVFANADPKKLLPEIKT
jgi:hypothetical protein